MHLKFWIYLLWCMTSRRGWEMTLRHDQAIKWAKAKVHVHSNPALCLGRRNQPSEANIKWKEQIHYFQHWNEYAELSGIDGEPIEFEWDIFPGFTSIEILRHIQESLKARQINPDQFQGRIIFMSMFNDIGWKKNGILHNVSRVPEK